MDLLNKLHGLLSFKNIFHKEYHPWETSLQKSHIFKGLSKKQLQQIIPLIEEVSFQPDDIIIADGEYSRDFYVIHQGEVRVVKNLGENSKSHVIAELKNGSCFGEMAVLNDSPRSATIEAIAPTTLLKISGLDLDRLAAQENSAYAKLATNIARHLAQLLQDTNELTVQSLQKELALTKSHIAMGNLLIYTIMMMTVYVLSVNLLSKLAAGSTATTILTAPLILAYALTSLVVIKRSGYPLSFFGFNLYNWRKQTLEALFWTLLFCLGITLVKFGLITFVPKLQHLPLIDYKAIINPNQASSVSLKFMLGMLILYTLTAPLQEMVIRGTIQSLLQDFLTGKYPNFWAVMIASAFFSIGHLHVSIWFSLLVLIPGFFWGALYAKQKSLLGVSISHILIGWWFIFGLGFTQIFRIWSGP
ncbi:MAG: putative cAMP/cGMP binding protein [Gammaproteobacteria bacterium]|jgi:CRP-like cAMP-binding protein|nr:putative cAMP/cGMP binding protein [Gammaproteobacteria bacterium]